MKRTLLLFSALMLSCIALWAHDVEIDGIYYNLDETNNTATVTYKGTYYNDYNEYSGSVTIPETIIYNSEIYSVTSIGGSAFEDCSGLTSVTIPNSVTSIGGSAFEDCSGLTSVTIPNCVTSIGSSAFENCSGLTSVTIPNSVTSIGEYAFYGCSGLTSVIWNAKNCEDFKLDSYDNTPRSPFYNISSSITSFTFGNEVEHIPAYLCYKMSKLLEVTIPNSVTSIGYDAFVCCYGLTEVTIPNSVTSIGCSAFSGCSGLTSVIWNAKNCKDFKYKFDGYYNTSKSPFYNIRSSITSFTFGNEVERIPAYLCYGMSKLTEVTIPNSVTSIGSSAFSGCSGLTSVTIPNSVTSIGSYAFSNCSGLTSVIWNAKNYKDFSSYSSSPFYECSNITSFTFGNEVEHIPAYLCYGMSKLTEITIPNSVVSIGDEAFYNTGIYNNTSNLDNNSVLYIGNYLIKAKSDVLNGSYAIKEGTLRIANDAFSDCSGLTAIIIPNSVTFIGDEAFNGCTSLAKINYVGTADQWADIDFGNGSSNPIKYTKSLNINGRLLADLKISKAKSIKPYAFYNCQSIKSVEIGESVTSIGGYAFYGCSELTSITIPNSVTSIGGNAFYDCSALTKVNYLGTVDQWAEINFGNKYANPMQYAGSLYINGKLLEDLKITQAEAIKAYAFVNSQSIKSVEIGESVTSIGDDAFYDCSELTSVTIPNSVTSIGRSAFYHYPYYNELTKVNYLGTVEQWVEIDFHSSSSNPIYYAEKLYINNELLTDVKIIEADSIKTNAFYNCNSIKSVEVGNSVTFIGSNAFEGCNSLTSVLWNAKNYKDFKDYDETPFYSIRSNITSLTFGNEVEYIPAYLCSGMNKLIEVTIPNSVTAIGKDALYDCSGLTDIMVLSNNQNYTSKNGVLFNKDKTVLIQYPQGKKDACYIIPNGVTTIGNDAFRGCTGLTDITIPNSVSTIGEYAFAACDNIEKVTAYPIEVPMAYQNSFAHYQATLYVPCDVANDYFMDNIFTSFQTIDCIAAGEVDAPDVVNIEMDKDNNAIITWPSTDGADSYELTISKDGELYSTLQFNTYGQLTYIEFANRSAGIGFQYTITDLEPETTYTYSIQAKDELGNVLESHKGAFTTNKSDEETAIIETLADANITISNGLIIVADADFSIYNLAGQNVTVNNGNLTSGIYMVSINGNIAKVMVK